MTVEDFAVEDLAVEDIAVEDIAVEDIAVEDIAVEDIAVEDIAVEFVTDWRLTVEGSAVGVMCVGQTAVGIAARFPAVRAGAGIHPGDEGVWHGEIDEGAIAEIPALNLGSACGRPGQH